MSILLGIANLFQMAADVIEYGPRDAISINTSLCPQAERDYRDIIGSNKTFSNPVTSSEINEFLRNTNESQGLAEDIVDETEEEAIRKAVEEKTCW